MKMGGKSSSKLFNLIMFIFLLGFPQTILCIKSFKDSKEKVRIFCARDFLGLKSVFLAFGQEATSFAHVEMYLNKLSNDI